MGMAEQLLDYKDVGRRLGFSRTQIYMMIRRGEFPEPMQIGRARRWRESDVDAAILRMAGRKTEEDTQ